MASRREKLARSPIEPLLAELRSITEQLPALAGTVDASTARRARTHIELAARALAEIGAKLDPVTRPASIFDPSNPLIVGRMIALTLAAQERVSLGSIQHFYGSGVYAIYYHGDFEAYAKIADSENPIYVGKADPAVDQAKEPVAQGLKLYGRLAEHAKSIGKAANLTLNDFECRFLVVSSGWQGAAEDYLIRLFRPIWNKEIKICYGIGKHGDSAETRANLRSPWDTMHPARKWAASADIKDQKSITKIVEQIDAHFAKHPPYKTNDDLLKRFVEDMRQLPKVLGKSGKSSVPDDA